MAPMEKFYLCKQKSFTGNLSNCALVTITNFTSQRRKHTRSTPPVRIRETLNRPATQVITPTRGIRIFAENSVYVRDDRDEKNHRRASARLFRYQYRFVRN